MVGVPDYIGNAISEYRMEKRDVVPGFPDDRASYDKLSVVVIGLKESKSYPNEFIGMLNTLLSPEIPVTQKKSLLKEKYSMKMESGLSREVDLMCNLSGYVEEKGIEKGIMEGSQKEKIEIAKKMLELKIDKETIAKATGLTEQEIEKILN